MIDDTVFFILMTMPLLLLLCQVFTLIVDSFKLNTNESIAKFLAFNVEDSIHKIHSADSDQKSYLNKAKTLTYNLKKNEVGHMTALALLYSCLIHRVDLYAHYRSCD
jgi:hypothetical protein